jgi:hypothetical protein
MTIFRHHASSTMISFAIMLVSWEVYQWISSIFSLVLFTHTFLGANFHRELQPRFGGEVIWDGRMIE